MAPCYSPVQAWQGDVNEKGRRPLVFKRPGEYTPELSIPCSGCLGCRLEYARQWAMRCRDEAKMHEQNCFITLTFDPKFRPRRCGLSKKTWQLFMKRFRKVAGPNVKFFMCGEYSPLNFYPHYHALIFGYDFPDKVFFKSSEAGEPLYTSAILAKVWGKGYCSVGALTFGSASYVCRYSLKKLDERHGDVAKDHFLVPTTGELRPPEFHLMSRGGRAGKGIGRAFYDAYKSDIFPADMRVVDGVKSVPPRYYSNIYSLTDPEMFCKIKSMRVTRSRKFLDGKSENDAFRLGTKELCKQAQITRLSRKGDFR